jgi:hypothetical protein
MRSHVEQLGPVVLDALRAGASVAAAARAGGVAEHTVRTWIKAGRREPEGRFGPFAAAFDGRQRARLTVLEPTAFGPLTHPEWEELLAEQCRRGNVQALKLWRELHPEEEPADTDGRAAARRLLAAVP